MTKGKCGKCMYGKGWKYTARCTLYECHPNDPAFVWHPGWECPYFAPKKQNVKKG